MNPARLSCYGIDPSKAQGFIDLFARNAPIITTPDGEAWVILDVNEPMMFREGAAS